VQLCGTKLRQPHPAGFRQVEGFRRQLHQFSIAWLLDDACGRLAMPPLAIIAVFQAPSKSYKTGHSCGSFWPCAEHSAPPGLLSVWPVDAISRRASTCARRPNG
jgi:hypothetical protein